MLKNIRRRIISLSVFVFSFPILVIGSKTLSPSGNLVDTGRTSSLFNLSHFTSKGKGPFTLWHFRNKARSLCNSRHLIQHNLNDPALHQKGHSVNCNKFLRVISLFADQNFLLIRFEQNTKLGPDNINDQTRNSPIENPKIENT